MPSYRKPDEFIRVSVVGGQRRDVTAALLADRLAQVVDDHVPIRLGQMVPRQPAELVERRVAGVMDLGPDAVGAEQLADLVEGRTLPGQHRLRQNPFGLVVEDALGANAPHLRDLREAGVHYIIGVKPGDHSFLFQHLQILDEAGRRQVLTLHDPATGILHHFRFCNGAPLNESNPNMLVNVLEYWEIHPDGKIQHFSWITDFVLTSDNVWDIMRGGRARWKIENETFNTLKNQGYHLEHNYGHGEQNLSVVLALLMMLAFLVDQVQQACCPLFQAAWNKMKTKCHLWEEIRNAFHAFRFDSVTELLTALIRGIERQRPVFVNTS